jgi:hypothetical protein
MPPPRASEFAEPSNPKRGDRSVDLALYRKAPSRCGPGLPTFESLRTNSAPRIQDVIDASNDVLQMKARRAVGRPCDGSP